MPKTVVIAGAVWKIKVGRSTKCSVQSEALVKLDGNAEIEKARIFVNVDPQYAPSYVRLVLLHEVLHAAIRAYGHPIVDVAEEERYVEAFSATLLITLRDNPDVVAFLFDTEAM